MKGRADTELQVRVRVAPSQTLLPPDEDFAADEEWSLFIEDDAEAQQEVRSAPAVKTRRERPPRPERGSPRAAAIAA